MDELFGEKFGARIIIPPVELAVSVGFHERPAIGSRPTVDTNAADVNEMPNFAGGGSGQNIARTSNSDMVII